ncbi:MAG: AmmeMemoRadiSam system protein B [Acidobacteria bacterium]|nr:MAG: AmmeMemoRadiSam system protein B [Acidobacteriota bacterium]PYV03131.1 MAG: AmmeMemoRadiSam system protein B [Acidobacteriota bacterium]PYV36827.1 MAG: AmmeMemoRadiSam system protein B [Acidobacteriota bacterium]
MEARERVTHPRLRPVEAFPVRLQGQDLVCLRDPAALAEQPIFLNGPLVLLVSLMDGSKSLRDIQAEFMRQTGEMLFIENIEELVGQLENHHYLDSPSFSAYYEALVQEFRKLPVRPATHAGAAYEGTAEGLRRQIDTFFEHPDGPGTTGVSDHGEPLRGLIAPHIDFHRGGPAYAHAYKALAEHPGADRFIIFGTCHNMIQKRFALTEKGYDTPLGCAETDQEFVRRLAAKLPEDPFVDEFAHRGEHSVEFQAVCLKYLLGDRHPFKIVPILVGSFHDIYSDGKTAVQDPEIQAMVDAVVEVMQEMPASYCLIAGADLAHVGRRFGDPSGPTERFLKEVEEDDRALLHLVEAGDAEGVFRSIAADNDRRRVCGYPPIYMTLRCLENPRGKLLQYRQWADLEAGAAVTYASVALF